MNFIDDPVKPNFLAVTGGVRFALLRNEDVSLSHLSEEFLIEDVAEVCS